MNDLYFCWLVELISDDYIRMNYSNLLLKLYNRDYIWELDYDKNRAADGLNLRDEYQRSTGLRVPVKCQNSQCTLLEMFVALARNADDDIMYDPAYGNRSNKWFWMMMENMGLDVYDNTHWYEEEVDRILDNFLHRRYDRNGFGGAFPLNSNIRDSRDADLWWQMNRYLVEHYMV